MVIRDESLAAFDQILCDVGANSAAEVAALGITIGDMVTFSTDLTKYAADGVFGGKALDDRLGCYVGARLLQELAEDELPFTLRFAATSSEEVGIRGAKTATQLIQPDLAFIVDVATFQNPRERSEVNQRQVGSGPILTHFDRTLAPNRTLQQFVKETAATASCRCSWICLTVAVLTVVKPIKSVLAFRLSSQFCHAAMVTVPNR